jgi:hypothetical protein
MSGHVRPCPFCPCLLSKCHVMQRPVASFSSVLSCPSRDVARPSLIMSGLAASRPICLVLGSPPSSHAWLPLAFSRPLASCLVLSGRGFPSYAVPPLPCPALPCLALSRLVSVIPPAFCPLPIRRVLPRLVSLRPSPPALPPLPPPGQARLPTARSAPFSISRSVLWLLDLSRLVSPRLAVSRPVVSGPAWPHPVLMCLVPS